MKHNFSVVREIITDALDTETHEQNDTALISGRPTPNAAFVALAAIEHHVSDVGEEINRYRDALGFLRNRTNLDYEQRKVVDCALDQ